MPRRGLPMAAALLLAASTLALAQRLVPIQSTRVKDLAAGRFLVASRDLPDPNFADTVVLLIQYDQDGAMGVVINRRTKVPLSRVFQQFKEAKGRSDPAYLGGPVDITGILALLRSAAKPEEARHVFADVYLISSRALLEKTMGAGTESSAFHVYLGHSGWAPGQLEMEVELGTWHIFRGDAAMVFDPDPDSVWSRLIRRTELRIAFRQEGSSSAIGDRRNPIFTAGRWKPESARLGSVAP